MALQSTIRILPSINNHATALCTAFSTSAATGKEHYKLVVVGGGAAGAAVQAKFASKLGRDKVAVIEPSGTHRYQAAWTLVGGGLKEFSQSVRPQDSVLVHSTWIKDAVSSIEPTKNLVQTEGGKEIEYDYLVMATGIQTRYDKIKGLTEAMDHPEVVSNYHPEFVKKTFPAIKAIQSGTALFTFPSGTLKCAGAPQKIAYLADAQFRKMGKRNKINMIYNTALPVIFGAPKYAAVLNEIAAKKDIAVNFLTNLIEVKGDQKEAVFEVLKDGKRVSTHSIKYDMLHAAPPCAPFEYVANCKELVNEAGFVTVDKGTLQHTKFPNVFGIGDCTDIPTSKTAAAVASQTGVLKQNLHDVMRGYDPAAKYNGYTSCPLTTSLNTVVLAEFDYTLEPLETFPVDQRKERHTMFFLKNYAMPQIYWHGLVRGLWEGPGIFRKILRLGS